jgi:hypothetical protein
MPPETFRKNDGSRFRPQGLQQCPIAAGVDARVARSLARCERVQLLRSGNTPESSALSSLNENTDGAGRVTPDNIGAERSLRNRIAPDRPAIH